MHVATLWHWGVNIFFRSLLPTTETIKTPYVYSLVNYKKDYIFVPVQFTCTVLIHAACSPSSPEIAWFTEKMWAGGRSCHAAVFHSPQCSGGFSNGADVTLLACNLWNRLMEILACCYVYIQQNVNMWRSHVASNNSVFHSVKSSTVVAIEVDALSTYNMCDNIIRFVSIAL